MFSVYEAAALNPVLSPEQNIDRTWSATHPSFVRSIERNIQKHGIIMLEKLLNFVYFRFYYKSKKLPILYSNLLYKVVNILLVTNMVFEASL